MEFINHDHFKKFNDLRMSEYGWINTRDKKKMTVLYIMSGKNELYESIKPYFNDVDFNINKMKNVQVSSSNIANMINLTAALYDDEQRFNITDLSNLDNGNLQLALNAMKYRFSAVDALKYEAEETYSIIKESEETTKQYYGITTFSDYVREKGLDFDKKKLAVYRGRGLLPEPAVKVGRTNGWSIEQIDGWIEQYNNDDVVNRYGRDKK